MADFPKYREAMSKWVFEGKVDAPQDTESAVESAKQAIGQPVPENAFEQAKALREKLMQNRAEKSTNITPDG